MDSKLNVHLPVYVKLVTILIGLYVFVLVLSIGKTIVIPIIFATIFAMLLSPVVSFFIRHRINRVAAIIFTIVPAILLTAGISFWFISQFTLFSDSFPLLLEKLKITMNHSVIWISQNFNIPVQNINDWITKTQKELLSNSTTALTYAFTTMGSAMVLIFIIPVYLFMILYYQPLIIEFFHRLFKRKSKNIDITIILIKIKGLIQGYLIGLLVEAAIIATLNSLALLIIGVDYAILFGIMGALLNVIPYLGGVIAIALPMIMAIITKDSLSSAIMVLIVYMIIQFIDNHYIVPKIVASKVKLNALISVVVVLAGGALWGIPGMFLSIPLIAVLKLIFDSLEDLKPWGYLLGDTMPDDALKISIPTKNNKVIQKDE